MAQRQLKTVLVAFKTRLNESRKLSIDVHKFIGGVGAKALGAKTNHRELITELAFLRAFLAWEAFLEQSFILYLVGSRPPRGLAPQRYYLPPNQKLAKEWVVPEGQRYADWTDASRVRERSERFFRDGKPYSPVLKSHSNVLTESVTLRNAIVHGSMSARDKFRNLVHGKIPSYPPSFTVGGFLAMTVPKSHPPESFLEVYLGTIEFAAEKIVPT